MTRAGTLRLLAAAAYDGLLVLAVLMVVTALLQLLTHGEAITHARVGAFEYLYRALLALCVAGYFGSGWLRRGQTLGMQAWGIRLEAAAGGLPRARQVALRLATAAPLYLLAIAGVLLFMARGATPLLAGTVPLALSFAWHALTGHGTLPDRLSATCIVRVARAAG